MTQRFRHLFAIAILFALPAAALGHVDVAKG